jgi:hypothetical protein
MDPQAFVATSFPPSNFENTVFQLVDRHKPSLVNGFDRVRFDEAIECFDIEPQSPTDLDRGDFPHPRFSVNGVYIQSEVPRRLLDIQEPPIGTSIKHRLGGESHTR